MEVGLAALSQRRSRPAGTVRLTMLRLAAMSIIEPMLPSFLAAYPDVNVEVSLEDSFTDIVTHRFDAGIRFGRHVEKDMIAVRVVPDVRATVIASPSYLAACSTPSSPHDLAEHDCINYRFASGTLFAWPFERAGDRFEVNVHGRLIFNDGEMIRSAAVAGHGIAYLYEEQVADLVASGRLVTLLERWRLSLPGHYIYYPSRRHVPPALAALVDALRQPTARLSDITPEATSG